MTAAILSVEPCFCSAATSLPSARTAPSSATLAAGVGAARAGDGGVVGQRDDLVLDEDGVGRRSAVPRSTLSQKSQNCSCAVRPDDPTSAGLHEAATPPSSATLRISAEARRAPDGLLNERNTDTLQPPGDAPRRALPSAPYLSHRCRSDPSRPILRSPQLADLRVRRIAPDRR